MKKSGSLTAFQQLILEEISREEPKHADEVKIQEIGQNLLLAIKALSVKTNKIRQAATVKKDR